MRFLDRADAGRRLGERVRALGLADPVVLGLPRGGVPVAYEVAAALGAPLDVFVARKVGAPGQPEYGVGAVAEGGAGVANDAALRALGIAPEEFAALAAGERAELARRVARYRGGRPLTPVEGRDVVLVDDGLATGVTAEAALGALREHAPRRLVLAAPVCAPGHGRAPAGTRRRHRVRNGPHSVRRGGTVVRRLPADRRRRGARAARRVTGSTAPESYVVLTHAAVACPKEE